MNVALLIALEEYAAEGIPSLPFAQRDAEEISKALKLHGFNELDQVLLLEANATKTIIESKIRRTLKSLTEEDHLILFYTGHAFIDASQTYLTCYDSQPADLAETSIPLQSILRQLSNSDCGRFTILFDAHTEALAGDGTTSEELPDFFANCKNGLLFASCTPGQTSWPSGQLKQGIWAHHLIEALSGNAPAALLKKTRLTAVSLQTYLQESIPKSLRLAFADEREQTPFALGKPLAKDLLLFDLAPLFAQRKADANPLREQAARLILLADDVRSIRAMVGFKKTHQIPTEVNRYAETFVAGLAAETIESEVDGLFAQLKTAFRFKRADVSVAKPKDGTATIVTPYFNYSVSVSVNPKDPSEVIWHRQVSEIKDLEKILSEPFANVFQDRFSTVELIAPAPVNLESIIDRIEELDNNKIKLEYDSEVTWCKIQIKGIPDEFYITPYKFSVSRKHNASPKLLLESFFKIQQSLHDQCNVTLLALE